MKESFSSRRARAIKLLAGFAALITIIFCSVKIATAVKYDAITVSETHGDIVVIDNEINNLTITPTIILNITKYSIFYKTTLSNPDGKKFQIKSITDDNTNAYVKTTYIYDEEMNDSDKIVYISLFYDTFIPFGEELDLDDIHITIDIEEEGDDSGPDNQASPASPTTANTPNTGRNGMKYLSGSTVKQSATTLPYIIVCIVALATIITVLPLPKRHRVQFNKIASIILTIIISGIAFNTFATTSQIEITIVGSHVSAVTDITSPGEVVSITFPNIYNNKVTDRPSNAAPGNAIILKTLDNKYVLMDTGPKTADIQDVIYNTLKNLQGKDDVVLNYLIVSHLDADHYGNVTTFLSDPKITIENIIYKHEIYANGSDEAIFQSITEAAVAQKANIITSGDETTVAYLNSLDVSDYDKLSEGMVIEVGKYLKLDFFNATNVYAGKPCQGGERITWTANASASSLYRTANGEYVYFDGSEYATKMDGAFALSDSRYPYADVTYRTTTTPITKENGSGMNRYFYAATDSDSHNICVSNPNSFGILAEVTTTNLKRYMYFPGDMENAGYSKLSSGANSAQLYENLTFENGEFKNNITPYAIPSEDDTATAIYNKLASDATALGLGVNDLLNNIVIYQEAHHGINNSEKAVWKLNINRSDGIYAIAETATNMSTYAGFNSAKTYWYTLGNIPAERKLRVGDSTIDGIGCAINMIGDTTCSQYTSLLP